MFKHNLIIIYRSFKRFKSTFLINLLGLSTGLACVLMIYLWVSDELIMDNFHEKDSRLFQVMTNFHHSDNIETSLHTPIMLSQTITEKIPGVEYAVGTSEIRSDITLFTADKHFTLPGRFVSKDFFNVFSYSMIQGNKNQVLLNKNSLVISDKLAFQFFNTTENVIGKAIKLQVGNKHEEVVITGIFIAPPRNSTQQFDFLLSYELYKDINGYVNWGSFNSNTYLLLNEGTNVDNLNAQLEGLLQQVNKGSNETLFLAQFSKQYLYGTYENGVQTGGRIDYIKLFSIIALFILLIACINFINLSTAKASVRVKEIGIKKAIGAKRKTLIFQYLGESVLIAFLSLIVALLLVALFLPQFNQITGKSLTLLPDIDLVVSILGITIFTGLLAGIYPACYLSGFNPAIVLKGKFKTSAGEFMARKGLVVFQFMLSIIFIVSVLVLYKQIEFLQTKSLGYDKEQIIYFKPEGKVAESMDSFISQVKNITGIINASSIAHDVVKSTSSTWGVNWEGKNPEDQISFEKMFVNFDMIETLGIKMKAGRAFSRNFGSDTSKIILNEEGIAIMGFKDPIGKKFRLYGKEREIIGVAKNFHFQSLHQKVSPLFFVLAPEKTWNIMVKIQPGKEKEVINKLNEFYQKFNPGYVLDYRFLDEDYKSQYDSEQRIATLSRYFAGLAIMISCLGLLGLAAFTAERRNKEISIRKVIGASTTQLVHLLSGEFSKIVLIAIAIALPLSYLIVQYWLNGFAYRIQLEWWYFIGAGLAALAIAWLTVATQAFKAAGANPVKSLRTE